MFQVLEKFHAGHYLVIIVGSSLASRCPSGVLGAVKLDFSNPNSLADTTAACQVCLTHTQRNISLTGLLFCSQ